LPQAGVSGLTLQQLLSGDGSPIAPLLAWAPVAVMRERLGAGCRYNRSISLMEDTMFEKQKLESLRAK
jgi:hypothetical protein